MPVVLSVSCAFVSAITIVYCFLLWYCSGIWWTVFGRPDFGSLPFLSLVGMAPLPVLPIQWQMIHWQLVALGVLFFSIRASIGCFRRHPEDMTAPVIVLFPCIAWIFLAILFHALAALLPMVSIGHIL